MARFSPLVGHCSGERGVFFYINCFNYHGSQRGERGDVLKKLSKRDLIVFEAMNRALSKGETMKQSYREIVTQGQSITYLSDMKCDCGNIARKASYDLPFDAWGKCKECYELLNK